MSFASCEHFLEGIGSNNVSMYFFQPSRQTSAIILLQMSFFSVGYNHTKTTLYHRMYTPDKYMVVDL